MQLSLIDELLTYLSPKKEVPVAAGETLRTRLEANDFDGFVRELKACFASIPYQWHTTGDLERYEAWYASLLLMCFRAIGVEVRSEEASSGGHADMVVLTGGQVFVFEYKMADKADTAELALAAAFQQIREQGYAEKYLSRNETVH